MECNPGCQDFTTHTRTHTPHAVTHAHARTQSLAHTHAHTHTQGQTHAHKHIQMHVDTRTQNTHTLQYKRFIYSVLTKDTLDEKGQARNTSTHVTFNGLNSTKNSPVAAG